MKLYVAMLLAAGPTAAQQSGGAGSLAMFDRFVGSCWTAELAQGVSDTHCFSLIYDGAHVRDAHRVVDHDKIVYRGETVYSRDGNQVVYNYINSLGGEGRGTATSNAQGIEFTLTIRPSPDANTKDYPTRWRWFDKDTYGVWDEDYWIRYCRGGEPEQP
jgi:hypothetical protein